jgi:chaperonin GroES
VKVGDTILFGKYSGTEIEIEDAKYLLLKETDIFAII